MSDTCEPTAAEHATRCIVGANLLRSCNWLHSPDGRWAAPGLPLPRASLLPSPRAGQILLPPGHATSPDKIRERDDGHLSESVSCPWTLGFTTLPNRFLMGSDARRPGRGRGISSAWPRSTPDARRRRADRDRRHRPQPRGPAVERRRHADELPRRPHHRVITDAVHREGGRSPCRSCTSAATPITPSRSHPARSRPRSRPSCRRNCPPPTSARSGLRYAAPSSPAKAATTASRSWAPRLPDDQRVHRRPYQPTHARTHGAAPSRTASASPPRSCAGCAERVRARTSSSSTATRRCSTWSRTAPTR